MKAKEKVSPGSQLPHIPTSETPKDRLGLAKWLTNPPNPLTPRVTVNRLWTEIFGSGLVSTEQTSGLREIAQPPPSSWTG